MSASVIRQIKSAHVKIDMLHLGDSTASLVNGRHASVYWAMLTLIVVKNNKKSVLVAKRSVIS